MANRWLVKLAMFLAAAVSWPPLSAVAQTVATAPTTSPASTQPADPVDSAILILRDPQQSLEWREESARNLVGHRDDPRVKPALLSVLSGANRDGSLAVAQALASLGWTEPDFVNPLFDLLDSRDTRSVTIAAEALANYRGNAQVRDRLIDDSRIKNNAFRISVIHALGAFESKSVAAALDQLLDEDDSKIREAACDALSEMTARTDLGHDIAGWKKWWVEQANRSDSDFTQTILGDRADAYMSAIRAKQETQDNAVTLASDMNDHASPDEQPWILTRFLESPDPNLRGLGCHEVLLSRGVPGAHNEQAIQQVRLLLGDVAPNVRREAANALAHDQASASAMVAQLKVETDDLARAAIVSSLADLPDPDPQAIRLMIDLINPEVSPDILQAAARGIAQGATIVNQDPELRRRAIDQLVGVLNIVGQPGTGEVEAAIVRALGELKDGSLETRYIRELDVNKPASVRVAALTALGKLDDPHVADDIIKSLDDPSENVRLAAAYAMTDLPAEIYFKKLVDHMDDPNDGVKVAVWSVLQTWLPSLNNNDLENLADDLKTNHPASQLVVMKALRAHLYDASQNAQTAEQRSDALRELAARDQSIGDVQTTQKQYTDAAESYRHALEYWQGNKGTPETLDSLSGEVIGALLDAHEWDAAADFANQIIKIDSADPQLRMTVQTINEKVKIEANNLATSADPNAYADATAFFTAMGRVALSSTYATQISEIHGEIDAHHASATQP